MKRGAFLIVFSLVICAVVVAFPLFEFNNPNPEESIFTSNTSIELNVTIVESSLDSLIYNWNGTNYTIYNDSLVLMINFDNKSGLGENDTFFRDLSLAGNNGTCSVSCPELLSEGKFGKASDFDGSSHIDTPYNPDYSSGDSFTYSLWFRTNSSQNGVGLFSARDGNKANNPLSEFWMNSSSVQGLFRGASGSRMDLIHSVDYATDEWHHLVAVIDDGDGFFYFNGELVDTGTGLNMNINLSDVYFPIGASNYEGTITNNFTGAIDELRVWHRPLGSDEVYQIYSSSLVKHNSTNWNFYVNQSQNKTTPLSEGTYTYFFTATNSSGSSNQTGIREVTVDATNPLISFVSPTPSDSESVSTSVEINSSITELNLGSLIYNWNGTNFTYYDDSMSLMYNFDNVSSLGDNSSLVVDLSHKENNGVVTGNINYDCILAKYNCAVKFNGTIGNYITDSSTDLPLGNNSYSWQAWVNWTGSTGSSQKIFNWGDVLAPGGFVGIGISSSSLEVDIDHQGNDWETGYVLPAGEWIHLAGTYNGTAEKLYVNGELNNTKTGVGALDVKDSQLRVGNIVGGTPGEPFNGSVDEIRVWNRTLSADEIYQQYISNIRKYGSESWEIYINQSENSTSGLIEGVYSYQLFVSDRAGNSNKTESRDLEVVALASEEESQNGETQQSSSSPGGGHPLFTPGENELNEGYRKIMQKNWEISFKVNDEKHILRVENISETEVRISVSSETQEASLSIGEERKFDVSGDDYYDILVGLNSIDATNKLNPKAEISIKAINEGIIHDVRYNAVDSTGAVDEGERTARKGNLEIITVVVLVMVVVFGFYLYKKRNKRLS